jgi:hypothetical protein
MEPLRSITFETPEDVAPSKWTMRIYSSKEALQDMPKLSWLDFVGQEIVPSIDFRNADDFKQVRRSAIRFARNFFTILRIVLRVYHSKI